MELFFRTPTLVASFLLSAAAFADPEPLFRVVPLESGLDFRHEWQPGAGAEREMDGAGAGGGVAMGDVNGDGRTDVVLTRPFGGARLFLNGGGWKFADATAASGLGADSGHWGAGCSLADVDNDGDLDLFICGRNGPNRLWLNDGRGTFRDVAKEAGVDGGQGNIVVAWADYDGDGDLDAYLVTGRPADAEGLGTGDAAKVAELSRHAVRDEKTGRLTFPRDMLEDWDFVTQADGKPFLIKAGKRDRLWRNDGVKDGVPRFTDVTEAAGVWDNGRGNAAVWWDFDTDGRPDLYVANDFFGPDRLWRNNGDGTFTDVAPQFLRHTPWFSMGCDSADLNNDGLPDLMASDMAGSNHFKDKMGMGDMDKQGWFLELPVPRQYMRNAVFINAGPGLPFLECAHQLRVAGTDWTWAVKLADFDCDGWVDLFVTNGMTGDFLNSDLVAENTEGGTVRHAPRKRDPNRAFRNAGGTPGAGWSFSFEDVGKKWGLERESVSFGAACGDLDGDGDLDLVVNNFDEPCSVYENTTPASVHRLAVRLVGARSNRSGLGATVTAEAGGLKQTRWVTATRGFFSSDEPAAFFGLGAAGEVERLTVRWPSGAVQVLENVAADRTLTVKEPADESKLVAQEEKRTLFTKSPVLATARHSERPFDDFARQPLLPNKLSQLGPGVAWGDVDGDGDADFFLGGAAGSAGRLYFNEGARADGKPQFVVKSFAPFEADAASEDMAAVFFDADGDKDADLLVVSGGVEAEEGSSAMRNRLYINDGRGVFTKSPDALPADAVSDACAAVADFDGDGALDVFVGGRVVPGKYPLSPGSRLLRNDGKGKFTDVTQKAAPGLAETGLVTSAVAADLTGDGRADLVLAREWGQVEVFLNEGGGRLTKLEDGAGLGSRSGWWNGLCVTDLDADGRPDIVATNFGLNTKYHPGPGHPARVYYADFDGSGSPQVVEAKEMADGTLLPVRGKSCSQNAMPFLRDKFPKFRQFASATLQQIYTPEKLADARKYEADSLESGVWWNETPAGAAQPTFRFAPLPALAQIAPSAGAVAADFDGDGRLDLALAQNFFSPQRETGWMDGGLSLVLLGRPNRAFEPVWPGESGISVPEDARDVTLCDVNGDGRPDLCFVTNDGPVRVFENAGKGK